MQLWSKAKQALAGEGQSKLRLYYVSHLSPPIREGFLPLLLFVELHLGCWNASQYFLILTLALGLDLFALALTLSEALLLRARLLFSEQQQPAPPKNKDIVLTAAHLRWPSYLYGPTCATSTSL